MGEPGRKVARHFIASFRQEEGIDLVIANSENAAGGMGITKKVVDELFQCGIDVLTSGNHAWDKKEGVPLYDSEPRLLRPANYPKTRYFQTPGKGSLIFQTKKQIKIGVLNLMGRVFMESLDCPFQVADRELEELMKEAHCIFVDFHGETTSEKKAMAFFLDGRISALIGTHTHVQTADEQIFEKGMAYLTDAGMTGPHRTVIGMDPHKVLQKFLTKRPMKFDVGDGDLRLQGVIVEIEEETSKATAIRRIDLQF